MRQRWRKYLIIIALALGCNSQTEDTNQTNSIQSKKSNDEIKRDPREAGELLKDIANRFRLNVHKGRILTKDVDGIPVIEKHKYAFNLETFQAKGEVLYYYADYVRCFQNLKYTASGLYNSVEIGSIMQRLNSFDPRITETIKDCALGQAQVEGLPVREVESSGSLNLASKVQQIAPTPEEAYNSAISRLEKEDNTTKYCDQIVDICEAHRSARLTVESESGCIIAKQSDVDDENYPYRNSERVAVIKPIEELKKMTQYACSERDK